MGKRVSVSHLVSKFMQPQASYGHHLAALDGHPFMGHPDGILGRPVQPLIKLAVPAGQRSLDDCSGRASVVLDQAKLVAFGIGHHDDV